MQFSTAWLWVMLQVNTTFIKIWPNRRGNLLIRFDQFLFWLKDCSFSNNYIYFVTGYLRQYCCCINDLSSCIPGPISKIDKIACMQYEPISLSSGTEGEDSWALRGNPRMQQAKENGKHSALWLAFVLTRTRQCFEQRFWTDALNFANIAVLNVWKKQSDWNIKLLR